MNASSEFRKIFSYNWLKKLFINEIRYKSARGIDHISTIAFEARLKENLTIIYRKTHDGTYRFSQYREKLISRGSERIPRVISIPTVRDKLVQKGLAEILEAVYGSQLPLLHGIISDVISAYTSGLYNSFLRVDVKDFYPSIVHANLLRQLKKKIRKKEILFLIENAISQITVARPSKINKKINSKGVPQGLSISNILANIYFSTIDANYATNPTFRYFRFVDDILVLCNQDELNPIRSKLDNDCTELGLYLHDEGEKSSKSTSGNIIDGFDYLGYTFLNGKISVRKKSIYKLHDSIISLFTAYKYSNTKDIEFLTWVLNIRITGCVFNKSKYGWLFFFSQINDLSLLGELDHFVQAQLLRFDITGLKPKSFIRSYYEIIKNLSKTSYIPNFDKFSVIQKQRILTDVFKMRNPPTAPHEVIYQFNKKMYKTVGELEKDLGQTS